MSGQIRPTESLSEIRAQAQRLGIDDAAIMSQENGLHKLRGAISAAIAAQKRAEAEAARVGQAPSGDMSQ